MNTNKSTLLKLFFIGIFLILNATNAFSQKKGNTEYKSGIIYTLHDTINCFIEKRTNYNRKEIKYKLNQQEREPKSIDREKIVSIRSNINQYDNLRYENKSIILERLKNGRIKLYKNSYEVNYVYFNGNGIPRPNQSIPGFNTVPPAELDDFYIVCEDQIIKLKKRRFKSDLKNVMYDNKSLFHEIDKLRFKKLLFELDLKNIIGKYNFWHKYERIKK